MGHVRKTGSFLWKSTVAEQEAICTGGSFQMSGNNFFPVKVTADCTERLWSRCSIQTLSWANWLSLPCLSRELELVEHPEVPFTTYLNHTVVLWFHRNQLGKGSQLQINQWWSLPVNEFTFKMNTHSFGFQMLRSKYEGSCNCKLSSSPRVDSILKKLDGTKESIHVPLTAISCFENFPCFKRWIFLPIKEEMIQCERSKRITRDPSDVMETLWGWVGNLQASRK